MFSSETMISMTDGSKKPISTIRVNDSILDKLNLPMKVTEVNKYLNHEAVGIQLNNGTGVFYCDRDVKFLCHNVNNNGTSTVGYSSINNIHTFSGSSSRLKSSPKVFSPESDVSITTYDDPTPSHTKDLYCIHTNDGTYAFYVNGVITTCEN